jgi:hypothetical protein
MTRDRILAEVRMQIETARDVDVNRHISTALTQLNTIGMDRTADILTVSASGTYEPNPALRSGDQAFNYYPDIRCLILPPDLINLGSVSYMGVKLAKDTLSNYHTNTMHNMSYAFTGTNELYLSFDLSDGDVLSVKGKWAIQNLELLPDRFEDWMMNHVLAGLYIDRRYRDNDLYGVYESRRARAWRLVRNTAMTTGNWTQRVR